MAMKEDRAREGKKAKYRKMGFGPMMDSGKIDFGDKQPLLKAKKEKQKKYQNPKKDERFNAAFRSRMKKAGFKDSEIGDTRLKKGGLSGGQAKIAAKAPPTNKIDAKDFAVLRAEKAKGRGMGLQDEKVKPGKVMKARKGLSFDEKLKRQEKGLTSKTTGKPTSLKALREMKGFKPGETPSDFNKRMDLKKAGIKAAKATKIGKIVLPIAAAGVAAQQYLKSKMKKKDEPKKKMGGGMMMQRPMMVKKGGGADTGRKGEFMSKLGVAINKIKRDRPTRPDLKKLPGKMGGGMIALMKKAKDKGAKPLEFLSPMAMLKRVQGRNMGGMMNKPMGYKAGKSVKAKCKLGRNKPTKMY